MHRTFIVLVLLAAMLWQSTSWAAASPVASGWTDLAHVSLHWQGKAHHHHDDGTYQVDESEASGQHMATDHVSTSPAIVTTAARSFPLLGSSAPRALHGPLPPDPLLAGLLRPPRRHA